LFFLQLGFAQKVGNGYAAKFEICHRQSSGTQQRCAISSAILQSPATLKAHNAGSFSRGNPSLSASKPSDHLEQRKTQGNIALEKWGRSLMFPFSYLLEVPKTKK